jgi:protein phosphatase 1 regulatory subunit 42
LETLEIAECGLDSLVELRCLESLRVLNLAGNRITSFEELEGLLSRLKGLEKLDLRGNPICKEVKYRDRVIVMGSFTELDEKGVVETQRETLKRMMNRKPVTAKPPPPKEPAVLKVKRLSKARVK